MLRQIQYFHSVVENNSFSLAAEECNISQSAISQQIKALENELGFKLLERNNRKFTLTPAGEHFYKKTLLENYLPNQPGDIIDIEKIEVIFENMLTMMDSSKKDIFLRDG